MFNKAKFDAAIDWLHQQGEYSATMLQSAQALDLVRETVNIFEDAFDQGIGAASIPPAMDAKLRESVFLFSACKTHQQLTEAAAMLRTDDGLVKPFEQFARDVVRVHTDYNVHYLNAEYNFAVSSSQMAAKWAEVESGGDSYNLQYRTAADNNVREAHRSLHNVTLSPTDPFWDSYYPPNGWGCRCTAVQVRKSKYETSDPEKAAADGLDATRQMSGGIDKGAIFRFNPGKSRQIFPPKHPYYKVSDGDKEQIRTVVGSQTSITNRKELEAELKRLSAKTNWFERGFLQLALTDDKRVNGSTDMNGNIFLSPTRMKHCISGVNKLKQGGPISFKEADSISTLWHEITHNRNKKGNKPLDTRQRDIMELANEFIARKTLPEFYKAFGLEVQHPELMLKRESTVYDRRVLSFGKVIELTKSNLDEVINDVKTHLFNESYQEQVTGLVQAIAKSKTALKDNGEHLTEIEITHLVRECLLYDESGIERSFSIITRQKR